MSMNIHELPKMNRCKGDLRGREWGRGLKNDMECERGSVRGQSKVLKASKTNTQPWGGGDTLLQAIYSTGTARVCSN